jgi:hypothetical protein
MIWLVLLNFHKHEKNDFDEFSKFQEKMHDLRLKNPDIPITGIDLRALGKHLQLSY